MDFSRLSDFVSFGECERFSYGEEMPQGIARAVTQKNGRTSRLDEKTWNQTKTFYYDRRKRMDARTEGKLGLNAAWIDLNLKLSIMACFYTGVMETRENEGGWIESFQRSVDGKAMKEPWCMGFIWHCVNKINEVFKAKTDLHLSESVMEVWEKTPKKLRVSSPREGDLVFWSRGSGKGHVGIVIKPHENGLTTIEGNTKSMDLEIPRDGVFVRSRKSKDDQGGFWRLGYLRVYPYLLKIGS